MPHSAPADQSADHTADDAKLDARSLSRMRWRSRRGLLENDLLIDRFFKRYAHELTIRDGKALMDLMSLSDNDLLDLLIERRPLTEVAPELDRPDIHHLLLLLKEK